MEERTGITCFKGNPLTLLGPGLKVGEKAPDFRVVDSSLTPYTLVDFAGKTKIICAVPSLDPPGCDGEACRFHAEAKSLPDDIVVLTISLDLPFAQQRERDARSNERIKILFDHQDRSFALAYGVLVKELQHLSRSVFVVDKNDTVRFVQHFPEITTEPDYVGALEAAKGEIAIKQVPMDGICGGY